MAETLEEIAAKMVAKGKGLLAADESSGTIAKRFQTIGLESTPDSRRDYREMLFRTDEAMRDYISGVILYDETIRQNAKDGTPLVDLIKAAGSVPGIKVDAGAKPLALMPDEKITEGLDGLRERLNEYYELGARFAKWRAVIDIGPHRPSHGCINANAHALARYAALCQEAGIVPIVEPEVLMDGPVATHDIDTCYKVTEWTLKTVFQELYYAGVRLEGIVLKPNMVIAGNKCDKQAAPEEVAEKTVRVLKNCVPSAVPGIAFLSGGQSDKAATEHLSLINELGPLPWAVTFSYGRALQAAALAAWGGKPENVAAGERAFLHRAHMNSLAATGTWQAQMEKEAA
ncbi:MAG: fructose-bisphosphate aldolase class I [Bauldia sp.]|nr:fructose-bisphosphate aldolase class I [Bauldia sp.]